MSNYNKRQHEEPSGRSRSTTNGFLEDCSLEGNLSSRHRSRQRSTHRGRHHHRSPSSSHLPNGGPPPSHTSSRINHRPASSQVTQSSRPNHSSLLHSSNKHSASPSSARSPRPLKQVRANQDDCKPKKPKESKEPSRHKMGGGFVHQKRELEKKSEQTFTLRQRRFLEKRGLKGQVKTVKYLNHDQLRAKIEDEMLDIYNMLNEEQLQQNIFSELHRRERKSYNSFVNIFEHEWHKETEVPRHRTSSISGVDESGPGPKVFALYNSHTIDLHTVQHISNNLTRETSPRPTMADMPEVECCEPRIVTKSEFDLCCNETAFLSFKQSDKNSSLSTFKPSTPLKYESLIETNTPNSTSYRGKKRKGGKAKTRGRNRTNRISEETIQDKKDDRKKPKIEDCVSKLQWLLGPISEEHEDKFNILRSCISQQVDPDQVIHRLRTESKPEALRLNSESRKRCRDSPDFSPTKRVRRNGEHPTKGDSFNGILSFLDDPYMFVGKRVRTGFQKDFMNEALGLRGQSLDLLQWFDDDLKFRRNLLLELLPIFDNVFNCDLFTPPTLQSSVCRERKGSRSRKSTSPTLETSQEELNDVANFRYCDEYNGWTRFPIKSIPPLSIQHKRSDGKATQLKRAKEAMNEMTECHRKFLFFLEELEGEGSIKRSSMTLRSRSNSGTGVDDLAAPPLPASAMFRLFNENEEINLEDLTETERNDFDQKQLEIFSSHKKSPRKNSISMFADFVEIESDDECSVQLEFSPRTRARSRSKPGKIETDSKSDPKNTSFGPVIDQVISELRPLAFRNKLRLQHLLDLTHLDQNLCANELQVIEAEFKLWNEQHQYQWRSLNNKEYEMSKEEMRHYQEVLDDLVVKNRHSVELSTELIKNSSVYSNFNFHHLSREKVRSVWHLMPMRQPELRRWLDYLLYQAAVVNREQLLRPVPPALPSSPPSQQEASSSSSSN